MIRRLQNILSALTAGRSILLTGPRGVGKTSLVKEGLKSFEHVLTFNLLLGDVYRQFANRSELFRKEVEFNISRHDHLVVFIDEVQRIPALLNEVHHLIEEYKGKLQFILTGSSARKLRREGANLLAGRARHLKMHPLAMAEVNMPLEQVLQYGQLPALLEGQDATYLQSYVDIYLREEIYQESLIRKQELFARFLDIAAQFSGELINFSKFAKLSGTNDNTVREYFQILVDTLLVHRVDGWNYSAAKQVNQQPRFYFFDIGILNAARMELGAISTSSNRAGKLFEHLVLLELVKLNDYCAAGYKFCHYREREKQEIDLILYRNIKEPPIAIEIKIDGAPKASDFKTLVNFKAENRKARCYCLTAGTSSYEERGVRVCPWQVGVEEIFKGSFPVLL